MTDIVLFDTSVLIAGFVVGHPRHKVAAKWLERALTQEISWAVSAHSLAECYAVLTRLPVSPKITPSTAKLLLEENVEKSAKIISLSNADYLNLIEELAALGLTGGIVYNGIIFKSAQKVKAKHILTLNSFDFERFLVHQHTDYIISI